MSRFTGFGGVVVAIALAFLVWMIVSRRAALRLEPPAPPSPYVDFEGVDKLASVTILRFYAMPGVLSAGEKAILCYGVAKAKAVRLDPPVARLAPSLNRCIQVAPGADTRYTLTAEGADGRSVSESFVIQVKAGTSALPSLAP